MEKQFVSFHVGDKKYCIDIMQVQEVVREEKVTRMPDVPQYVEGIINLRGVVTPVISVRKKLGIVEIQVDEVESEEEEINTENKEELMNALAEREKKENLKKVLKSRNYLKLIIIRIEGVQVGFLVDGLDRVFSVDDGDIQSAEGVAGALDRSLIDGVIRVNDVVYIILNAKKMLDMDEKQFIKDEIIE